jgi:hypothetical protein
VSVLGETWPHTVLEPVPEPLADLLGGQLRALALIARDDDPGGGHSGQPRDTELVGRWARGRVRRPAAAESTYCAEVVAGTYAAMGLLDDRRPTNYYDPGMFWSGDDMRLERGARLGEEIRVDV